MSTKDHDCHTYRGAGRLAKTIEQYWRGRGFASVVVERFQVFPDDHYSPWGVRSNLVRGLPPR